jgi:hypothetical protein
MKSNRTGKYPTLAECIELANSEPVKLYKRTNKKAFIEKASKIPQNNLPDGYEKLMVSNYAESLGKFAFRDL